MGHLQGLAATEMDVARTVSRLHLDNMRALERAGQIWVNPRVNQRKIDNKIIQLRVAADLGLRTPRTLISNDPGEVRPFVEECTAAIVKPITPMFWNTDGRTRAMATRDVTVADLQTDASLVGCPMIYQEKVEKLFELRVTFFGEEFVCARLDSQGHQDSRTDFRTTDPANLSLEEIPLKPDILARLNAFRKHTGLLHGSFDLAVDTQGNHIFFEINEQGQFLWLEEVNPEIRMLDRLVSFMEGPSDDFRWNGRTRFAFSEWDAHDTGCS